MSFWRPCRNCGAQIRVEDDCALCGTPRPPDWIAESRGHETPCWIWQGAPDKAGYGHFNKTEYAHRVYYESAKGPVPEGLEIDHLCRVRICVNPDHLEAVTRKENSRRGARTRLTAAQAEEIRSSTVSPTEVAKRFGITSRHVHSIRAGERWAA